MHGSIPEKPEALLCKLPKLLPAFFRESTTPDFISVSRVSGLLTSCLGL